MMIELYSKINFKIKYESLKTDFLGLTLSNTSGKSWVDTNREVFDVEIIDSPYI